MFVVIISLILCLVVFAITGIEWDNPDKYGEVSPKGWKIKKLQVLSLLPLLLILFSCFTNIGANKVGIAYNPFKGGVQNYTLGQGYRVKSPLTNVYKINTEVQELMFENISVQTNDAQFVNAKIKAQVKIDSAKAFEYFSKYRDKSLKDISSLISATIQKELETVTTTYNIMDVLGAERDAIVNKTLVLIKEELAKDGIEVLRMTLVDTDAGSDIENAIAKEAVAKKEAETAEYNKQKAELEGEAKVIQAQKEKEANELINQTLTRELLVEQWIEKWDGKLPTVAGEGNMIDITELLK